MLREAIFNHPSTILLGCAAWIPLAIWIVAFVYWMIGGDIDAITGFVGIIAAIGLGGLTIKPPSPNLVPVNFTAIMVITLMFPFVRSALNRRELRSVDIEAIERAYESMRLRPNDPMARMKIARHLFALGYGGHALMILESALKEVPARFFQDEIMKLRSWKSMPYPASAFAPIVCIECSTSNPVDGPLHCPKCGRPFVLDRVRGKIMGSGLGQKLIGLWLILVSLAVGVTTISALSFPWNLVSALSSLAVLTFGILIVMRKAGHER